MKYEKPEIVTVGTAASLIQGSPKAGGMFDLNYPNEPDHSVTIAAYEADE
jgi:hypothetical protein